MASLHFEIQGVIETIRQHRTRLSLCEAIGEYAMSERIRGSFKGRSRHLELVTALREGPRKG